jgi:hypothetical protein
MMDDPQQSCNNLLADGALRCSSLPMKLVGVLLSGEEIEPLERVRALGFSSNAEVLRCATLAWANAAAQLPDESPLPLFAADSADVCPASSSANL